MFIRFNNINLNSYVISFASEKLDSRGILDPYAMSGGIVDVLISQGKLGILLICSLHMSDSLSPKIPLLLLKENYNET